MSEASRREQVRIVCFSEVQWKYVRTRKQQVINRFPKHWRVLFLSSVVKGKPNNFLPEKEGNVVHACVPVFKNFPPGAVRTLFSLAPVRFAWNLLLWVWLKALFLVTGFNGAARVFYVSNIYYGAVLPFLKSSLVFYDCNDDHLAFPGTPPWAEGYFRRVALSSDFAVAVSSGLAERLRSVGVGTVHHIGNGVDFELFREAARQGRPAEMRDLRRPVIGYSGAVAPWFDFELLSAVAESFPEGSVVLLGPVFDASRGDLERVMAAHQNVHHIGIKPYARLGGYLAAMDVCIVPLVMNELMRLADPNKLYEYAAAGRPIVTLRHSADLDALAGFVHVAETRDEFIEHIRTALSSEPRAAELEEFARRNSWQAKADRIAELITDSLCSRS
jgi:teichuronic acid biosynthesis glycosyltransferase TuaH